MNRLHTFCFEFERNGAQQRHCTQFAAINILERRLRLYVCGDNVPLDRLMKQETTKTTIDTLAA